MSKPDHDPVNAPAHYTRLDPQPLLVIEAWSLDFHTAQAIKYIARAGHKDENTAVQDLEKAVFYLRRRVAMLRAEWVEPVKAEPPPIDPDSDAIFGRITATLREYPPQPEPRADNVNCTDRAQYGAYQTGDCSTVTDDKDQPWQSVACDSCIRYYNVGGDKS